MNRNATIEKYVTEHEAAEYLGLKPKTLRNWRYKGSQCPFYKTPSGCIRYLLSDLDKVMRGGKVEVKG